MDCSSVVGVKRSVASLSRQVSIRQRVATTPYDALASDRVAVYARGRARRPVAGGAASDLTLGRERKNLVFQSGPRSPLETGLALLPREEDMAWRTGERTRAPVPALAAVVLSLAIG